jgi:ATP-dependent exoDNAse (exonuclease V) beta subunit
LRHILVDEFQDTSVEQIELLQALTAGWAAGDGRTLFVVGDPMQSIYQFREAEVGLFLQARDQGIGEIRLESLELRYNFRSTPPLIRWLNEHFAQVFPALNDARLAAIRYLPSLPPPSAVADDQGAVRLHRLPPEDALAEAERVVQIVRATRQSDPQATIAILVAGREHAQLPAAQLRAAGFNLRGVDLERLRDRPVVRDLSALTRALLHGADRTAWLALLRAPWCALTLAEIDAVLGDAGADLFSALTRVTDGSPSPPQRRIARVCAALMPAIDGAERGLPLWQRVEHSWLRLAGPAVHRSEVDRIDAQRFLDALAVHADAERLAGEGIDELTDELWSASPAQAGAIELMTMHAAKGLEWDVVILPGLHRRLRTPPDPLLHWIDLPRSGSGTDLLLAPIRASTEDSRGPSLANYIKALRRQRAQLERARLLYVAATRARRQLHLLGAAIDSAVSGSLLAVLWPAVGEEFLALLVAAAPVAATRQSADARNAPQSLGLSRLPPNWSPSAPPAVAAIEVASRRLRLGSAESADTPEYSWVGASARAVGTIVHAELHRLTTEGAAAGHRSARDYQAWLAELGVPAVERARAAQRVTQALRSTLEDERGRWLLSGAHPDARSEWRLTGVHAGRVVNIIIDRLLTDEHGDRWIIDYKTSTHEGGDVRLFLDSEAQRYQPQLARYAALVEARGGPAPRLALYFPLLGEFREIGSSVD